MLVRRRSKLIQTGLPAPLNGNFVTGAPELEDVLLNEGSVIPSQVPPEPPGQYAPHHHADGKEQWQTTTRNRAEHLPNFDPTRGLIERNIVHPGTVLLT